jgi:hypothetical protein
MANQWDCAIHLKGKDPIRWPKRSSGYQVEHDDLFASIVEGKPYNEAEFNAMATMTAILGRMATYSGQVVAWDDAFNSTRNLGPERLAWDAEPPVKPGPDSIYPCAVPGVTKPFRNVTPFSGLILAISADERQDPPGLKGPQTRLIAFGNQPILHLSFAMLQPTIGVLPITSMMEVAHRGGCMESVRCRSDFMETPSRRPGHS